MNEYPQIWVRITFNDYSLLEEKEKLVEELRKECPVQVRGMWYPAACTGCEFLVELFVNSPIGDFITGIVVPGLVWDLTKSTASASLKYIWNVMSSFLKKNEGYDLQNLKLHFDDIDLQIDDISEETYGSLLRFYQQLPRHLQVLQQLGVKRICKIELPYMLSDERDEYGNKEIRSPYLDAPEDEIIWKITYELGLEHGLYNPAKEILVSVSD